MKKETMRKFSVLGLVLIGASAVTAAVLPKSEPKKATAKLQGSLGPNNTVQRTCTMTDSAGLGNCNYTATNGAAGVGSRTTAANATSSITTAGGVNKVKTITGVAGRNSSQSPA